MVILDFGSGGTCRNDPTSIREMILQLSDVDVDRKCTIKWQLWDKGTEPQCTRLDWEKFEDAFNFAAEMGFRTTASVFDKPSLDYLLTYDIPFVKLANRPYLRHLSRYVPRGIPIVMSIGAQEPTPAWGDFWNTRYMGCVSDYPASIDDYESEFWVPTGISDHTVGLDLWRKYHPSVYEKHYRLPDQRGPDCGPWCITPSELKEVLG